MKYIAVICLTVFAWILMRWKKQYKKHILGGFVIVMILLSFIYNIRTLSLIVPFYYPVNQTFYQPGFLENGEYPDSFLPLLLNGKTVYTKDDSISIEQCKEEGKSWLYSYY
ncbi:MAG TPA: hypothetical protein PLU43_11740, partial [Lachnospiraceae bacterium]|nr:hypothetical protein [Lachnospiraceae bacterium]